MRPAAHPASCLAGPKLLSMFPAAASPRHHRTLAGPKANPTIRCRSTPADGPARRSRLGDRLAPRVEEPLEDQIVLEHPPPATPPQATQLDARDHGMRYGERKRPAGSILGRRKANSHRPLDHQFLDLADRLGRIEVLRADVDAVHDRMATEQAVRILEVVEPLSRRQVARIRDKAVRREQSRRTDELVRVPPERRT